MTKTIVRSPSETSHLRELNKSRVRNIFRRDGALTRTDVSRISGLTKPTVSVIVRELLAENAIFESEEKRPITSGTRPLVYEYNRLFRLFIGVHIGVTTTDVMVANDLREEIMSKTAPTPVRNAHAALLQAVDLVRAVLTDSRLAHDSVAGVGVCLSGMVDNAAGRCLLAPNLGWKNVDVASYFTSISPSVVVNNVIHAALEAEHVEGAAQGINDTVLLFEDNGVGAGLMGRGQTYGGADGLAGELGHCKMPGVKERCECGAVGCLETQVSAQAALRRAGDLLPAGTQPATAFAALSDNSDKEAQKLLRLIGTELGEAASWLVNLVNPRVVLVGGTYATAGSIFLDGFREALNRSSLSELSSRVEVRECSLPITGAARGALLLAERHVNALEEAL